MPRQYDAMVVGHVCLDVIPRFPDTVVLAPPRIDRVFLHNPGTNDEFSADALNTEH